MSTNALIAYKNENGKYNVNSIHYDGYIKDGVGQSLAENWTSFENIKSLCNGAEIRCLGETLKDTEVFSDYAMGRRKNLTFDELCNTAGNYDYSYVYEDDMWRWLEHHEDALTKFLD